MKKRCGKILLSGVFMLVWTANLFAQAPDTLWTKTYGGGGDDWGFSAEQTSDGGYIIAGQTDSFGAGGLDLYLIKTDADGDTLWTRTYGGTRNDMGGPVQQTLDGGYIVAGGTGSFGGLADMYLVKTDADGDTLWTRTYGETGGVTAMCVQQTSDSGYILVGPMSVLGPDVDFYLVKTEANGDTIWTKTYGRQGEEWGSWVQETSDSGYIVVGFADSLGGIDVWLLKTDADGDTLWTKTYGGIYGAIGYSVQQTSDGGYIVAGITSSDGVTADVYLIKTDANGDTLWTKTHGGAGNEDGRSVQETSDSGYIVTGSTDSFGAGGMDVYLIKTDANGDALWTETYGGTGDDGGISVQQTSDGGYVIAGYTDSFGAGSTDVYLVKIGPETGIEDGKPVQELLFAWHTVTNPFRDRTLIKYELPEAAEVRLVIYNLVGQEVRRLRNEYQDAGLHTVTWNATDNSGRKVPSGPYFLRLEAGDHTATRKLSVMR